MMSPESVIHSSLAGSGSRLRLPLRPRFLDELVVIPVEDGVVIEGADRPHMIEGNGVRELLPMLLPLMNGSRTMDQIRCLLPNVRAADLHAAVSLLFSWSLVEDGEKNEFVGEAQETLGFFRRYAGVTGARQSGLEAYQRLRSSEITLLDSGEGAHWIDALRSLLAQSGVEHIATFTREALLGTRKNLPTQSLIVSVCFTEEDSKQQADLDDWCHAEGRSWLRAALDTRKGFADIGPFFNSVNACYRCFHDLHCSQPVSEHGGDQETNAQLLISLLAVEIIYLLSSIGPSLTERGFQRHELQEWSSRNLRCVHIPGCIRCRPGAQKSLERPLIDTAVVFEDYIGLPARPQSSPRVTDEIAEAHADLGRQTTRLLNSTQIALPRSIPKLLPSVVHLLCETQADRHQPLTIDDLAIVLMMTAGVRAPAIQGQEKQRWAATAGNLGSVELFIVVRNVSGLAPGIYFYQSDDHSLAAFKRRAGALESDEFIRRITGSQPEDLADVLVLFTGAFHRVVRKYQQFGYRLLQFDAGVAMSQLQMVGQALNMNPRALTRWPDDLVEDQLNLATQHQQLTAAVALSGKQGTQRPAGFSAGQIPLRTGTPPSCKSIQKFSELSAEQVLEMLFAESRLHEEDLCASPFEIPPELQTTRGQETNVKRLPLPHQTGRSVGEVLAARTSVRHYSAKPVTADQLGSMLHHAHEGDLADWPLEHTEGQALTFLAIASRVQGVEPGVYAYVHQDHTLAVAKPVIAVEKMIDLFVQPEFASVPVIIWISGNLAAACARHGALGHRQLLLRAGAAANRLWMAAMAMDLEGCIVAGVVPGAARQQLGLDGYRHASLIAFAAGYGAKLSPSVPGLV